MEALLISSQAIVLVLDFTIKTAKNMNGSINTSININMSMSLFRKSNEKSHANPKANANDNMNMTPAMSVCYWNKFQLTRSNRNDSNATGTKQK